MKKLGIILVAMLAYSALTGFGPTVPGGSWSFGMTAIMLLLPIGGFIWAIRSFRGWHRSFHRRMVLEGLRMRRG